jgi:hypothetical protein
LTYTEVDAVFSSKRQAEIAEVIDVLKRFRPSKIAVEAGFNDDRVQERCAEYVAGEHEPGLRRIYGPLGPADAYVNGAV